ncbi:MAG: hypothetical protein R3D60_08745 [Paracoccaceae bacterium]
MKVFLALAFALISPAAFAETPAPLTAETALPVIEQAFSQNGCAFAMQGGELAMAEAIATLLGTDVATVTSRENGNWQAINQAMDGLITSGRFAPDADAGVFRLAGCEPA